MEYQKTVLHRPFRIENIVSVHYFEYTTDFAFSGEMHDFWELFYCDKSEVILTSDNREVPLPCGCVYFHKPMEFHNVRTNGHSAPNSVVVGFSSPSPELYEIADRPILCNEEEKTCLASIVEAATEAFSSPLGDPYTERLIRREGADFASEQLLGLSLEQLCIRLIRRLRRSGEKPLTEKEYTKSRRDEIRLKQICAFLEEHVNETLTSEQIQKQFFISESTLQKLFQRRAGCGVMQYFQRLKVEKAKSMIRENGYNFSEITQRLSFSSVHYFSRRFKIVTGMTPSEYAASVKSILSPKS